MASVWSIFFSNLCQPVLSFMIPQCAVIWFAKIPYAGRASFDGKNTQSLCYMSNVVLSYELPIENFPHWNQTTFTTWHKRMNLGDILLTWKHIFLGPALIATKLILLMCYFALSKITIFSHLLDTRAFRYVISFNLYISQRGNLLSPFYKWGNQGSALSNLWRVSN